MQNEHVSGFVTIIGRPNVGKSTLLNQIIGDKISIISDKIQTTRHAVHGILSGSDHQIVFIDTPGVHKPKHRLGDFMVDISMNTLQDCDVVLFMVNAKEGYGRGEEYILERLKRIEAPVFLLINKVDLIHPDELFSIIDQYKDKMNFTEVVPISAQNGNNVAKLIELLKHHMPVGPRYYDENQVTDKSEQFMISELIREKVLMHTEEEVPHSINVIIESMKENNQGRVHIQSLIITERKSQKGILIGKQGQMLKKIGRDARKDIELMLNKKVFLELWVKVEKDWRNRQSILTQYGFQKD